MTIMSAEASRRDMQGRIAELTTAEREYLMHALQQRSLASTGQPAPQRKSAERLVACVCLHDGEILDAEALRGFLSERLPDYMIPQVLIALDRLPKTDAGKTDRTALAAMGLGEAGSRDTTDIVTPRNEQERILAEIWADVLGLADISVHDNFFEVGGDSLLSIRILARAGSAGLRISPEEFFSHPTIAEQAALAESPSIARTDIGPVSGPIPLLPVQHWFFDHIDREREHWNQSSLFRVSEPLELEILARAVREVVQHHDALRIGFRETDAGWEQHIGEAIPEVPVQSEDMTNVDPDQLDTRIEELATAMNHGFELADSPLLRLILIRTPAAYSDRLLIVAHHLIVDAVSFRILVEDLGTICRKLQHGHAVSLPQRTTSIKTWAQRLGEYARTVTVAEEGEFWSDMSRKIDRSLRADYPDTAAVNTMASVASMTTTLDPSTTRALLYELPSIHRATVMEILLAALLASSSDLSDGGTLAVHLEGHGRETLFDDLDISRTIGWFTSVYPIALRHDGAREPGRILATVKEQFRLIPRKGVGYGLIRYLAGQEPSALALRTAPDPQIVFNYLGQIDRLESEDGLFQLLRHRCGQTRGSGSPRAHWLDVNAWVSDSRLSVDWHFSRNLHRAETIEMLGQRFSAFLVDMAANCRQGQSAVVTPSDFPLAGLGQQDLDDLSDLIDAIDQDEGS